MNCLKNGCFLAAAAFCIILICDIMYLRNKIDELNIKNSSLETLIEVQNSEIKKRKLEFEEYKKQAPKVMEKVKEKYKYIKVDNKECANELKEIKNSLDLFFK